MPAKHNVVTTPDLRFLIALWLKKYFLLRSATRDVSTCIKRKLFALLLRGLVPAVSDTEAVFSSLHPDVTFEYIFIQIY